MADPKKHVNPLLLLLAIVICVCAGVIFTHYSTDSSKENTEGTVVAETESQETSGTESSETEVKETAAEEASDTGASAEEAEPETEDTKETASDDNENDSAEQTEETASEGVSAPAVSEAAGTGTWTSSGSSWMYMINGTAYTGWLTDTDGKTYFFNDEGIMQTGWVDSNGKRYYMDLDGIMQADRIVTVEGKSYQLLADGSLEGYESDTTPIPTAEPTAAPEPAEETAGTPQPTAEAETTAEPEPTAAPEPTAEPEATATPEPTAAPEVTPTPAPQADKYAALTFNEGPGDGTSKILDVLEANGAKATFFMNGTPIVNHTDLVTRMESLGCELGNLSYDNLDLTTMDYQGIKDQFDGVNEALNSIVGHYATAARAPYNSINDDIIAAAYLPIISWSVDSADSNAADAQTIVDTVESQIQDGSVVLLHDTLSLTADAVEKLVPELISQGYQLVTVSELASVKGTELQNGGTYSSFSAQTE